MKSDTQTTSSVDELVDKITADELAKLIFEHQSRAQALGEDLRTLSANLGPDHPTIVKTRKGIDESVAAVKSLKERIAQLQSRPKREIKIFTLENGDAAEYATLLKTLYRQVDISADPRTRSIVAAGAAEDLRAMEAILLRLDENKTSDKSEVAGSAKKAQDIPGSGNTFNGISFTQKANTDQLSIAIAEHEEKAKRLAEQIRKQSGKLGAKHPDQIKARKELEQTLTTALDLKFQLEQSQLKDLEDRLSRMRTQFQFRKAASKKIVERRTRELLEGNSTQWKPDDSVAVSPPAPKSTTSGDVASTVDSDGEMSRTASSHRTRMLLFAPKGMQFAIDNDPTRITIPAEYSFIRDQSQVNRYLLSFFLQGEPDASRFSAVLDIYPSTAGTAELLSKNAVPMQITDGELNQLRQGSIVTKVVYRPELKQDELQASPFKTLTSMVFSPGTDVVALARNQGTVLASLRLAISFERLDVPPPNLSLGFNSGESSHTDLEQSSAVTNPFLDLAAKRTPMHRKDAEAREDSNHAEKQSSPSAANVAQDVGDPLGADLASPEEWTRRSQTSTDRLKAAKAKVCEIENAFYKDRSRAADLRAALNDLQSARMMKNDELKQFVRTVYSPMEMKVATAEAFATSSAARMDEQRKLFEGGKIGEKDFQASLDTSERAKHSAEVAKAEYDRYRNAVKGVRSLCPLYDAPDFLLESPAASDDRSSYPTDATRLFLEAVTGVSFDLVQFEGLNLGIPAALRVRESANAFQSGDLIVAANQTSFGNLEEALRALLRRKKKREVIVLRGGLSDEGECLQLDQDLQADILNPASSEKCQLELEVRVRRPASDEIEVRYVTGIVVSLDGLAAIPIAGQSIVSDVPIVVARPCKGTAKIVGSDDLHELTLVKLDCPGQRLFSWIKCREGMPARGQELTYWYKQSEYTKVVVVDVDTKSISHLADTFSVRVPGRYPSVVIGTGLESVTSDLQGIVIGDWKLPEPVPPVARPDNDDDRRIIALPAAYIEKLVREYQNRNNSLSIAIPGVEVRPTESGSGSASADASSSVSTPFLDLATKYAALNRNVSEAQSRLRRANQAWSDGVGLPETVVSARHDLDQAILKRSLVENEYAAMLRDLELQVASAELDVNANRDMLTRMEALNEKGAVTGKALLETRLKLQQSMIALDRIKLRFELYKKAGEGLAKTIEKGTNDQNILDLLKTSAAHADDDRETVALVWDSLGLKLGTVVTSLKLLSDKYRGGLLIMEVATEGFNPAAQGIQNGDILVGLDKWETASLANVEWILRRPELQPAAGEASKKLKYFVRRNDTTHFGYLAFSGVKSKLPVEIEKKQNASLPPPDQLPGSDVEDGSMDEPAASKSLDEWLDILRRNRNPESIPEIAQTIVAMSQGPDAERVASAIFATVEFMGSSREIEIKTGQALAGLKPEEIAGSLVRALRGEDPKARRFALNWLSTRELKDFTVAPEFPDLARQILDLGKSEDPGVRFRSQGILIKTVKFSRLDPAQVSTEERRTMVKRLAENVPAYRVVEILVSIMNLPQTGVALAVSEDLVSLASTEVIKPPIQSNLTKVLTSIVQGSGVHENATREQRIAALQILWNLCAVSPPVDEDLLEMESALLGFQKKEQEDILFGNRQRGEPLPKKVSQLDQYIRERKAKQGLNNKRPR